MSDEPLLERNSIREVAAELGMSRKTVEAIEKKALAKLRRALKREGLTLEDFIDGDRMGKRSSFPDGWE